MPWSFKVGRILGIEVKIHLSFVAFILFILVAELVQYGFVSAIVSFIFLISIFGCVFLHEMGHCIVATSHNFYVRDITLWPLGGIAAMEDRIKSPSAEIEIALAGPLVSFVLFFLFSPLALAGYFVFQSPFFTYLAVANLAMALFNLIPAFPMDGGRIYRAWLISRLGYVEATRRTARLAMILALVMGIAGIFFFPLLLIAIFIFFAARQELSLNFFHYMPEEHRRVIQNIKEETIAEFRSNKEMEWIKKKWMRGKRRAYNFFKKIFP